MKRRARIASFALIAMMATVHLFAQEKDWSLVGVWINPHYEGSRNFSPKSALTNAGAINVYYHIDGSLPWSVGTYVVESDWTEPGAHWYKVKFAFTSTWKYVELVRLSNDGNTYESVGAADAYPSSLDTSDMYYSIKNRQE
jgi:hypothetical protein